MRSTVGSGCDTTQTICTTYDRSAEYVNFFTYLMRRYQGKVRAYEIWNEPDGQWSWRTTQADYLQAATDRGADYTTLLRAAYPAAKAIDPQAVILGGSLSNVQKAQQTMLQSMYTRGAKNYFDVYSQHYYCDPPGHNYCNSNRAVIDPQTLANTYITGIVPVLKANGDQNKPVWVTETGYSSLPSTGVTEAVQADYLTKSYNAAKAIPGIDRLYWYQFDESGAGSLTVVRDGQE